MKMKKIIIIAATFITAFLMIGVCVYSSGTNYHYALQKSIAQKVIRFHVIANSDSETDQRLKLAVRDGIGHYMGQILGDSDSIEESRSIVNSNLEKITRLAAHILREQGCTEEVLAKLTVTDFPQKTYGKYTFPPGKYEALEIVIGKGDGKNWWCVMYPNLCFSNAVYEIPEEEDSKDLKKTLTSEEYESIMDNDNYKIQFRLWEFITELMA